MLGLELLGLTEFIGCIGFRAWGIRAAVLGLGSLRFEISVAHEMQIG